MKELEAELANIIKEKEDAIRSQEFEKAAEFRDKEHTIKEHLDSAKSDWENKTQTSKPTVDEKFHCGRLYQAGRGFLFASWRRRRAKGF